VEKKLVILRAYGGQPLIRRIFEVTNKVVYVTDDSREDGLVSLGFPLEDVFEYDPQLAAKADQLFKKGKWDWNKLKPLFRKGDQNGYK
jgi:hypothetical protein